MIEQKNVNIKSKLFLVQDKKRKIKICKYELSI